MEKLCIRCGETKDISCFNKDRRKAPDGVFKAACKACEKIWRDRPEVKERKRKYNKEYREANRERLVENDRVYRKATYEQRRKAQKLHEISPRGRAQQKAYRLRRKHKIRAGNAVNKAVAKGAIQHISICLCAGCEQPAKEYHHPNGYAKEHWFDIVPLCKACHIKRHSSTRAPKPQFSHLLWKIVNFSTLQNEPPRCTEGYTFDKHSTRIKS